MKKTTIRILFGFLILTQIGSSSAQHWAVNFITSPWPWAAIASTSFVYGLKQKKQMRQLTQDIEVNSNNNTNTIANLVSVAEYCSYLAQTANTWGNQFVLTLQSVAAQDQLTAYDSSSSEQLKIGHRTAYQKAFTIGFVSGLVCLTSLIWKYCKAK